MRRLIAAMLLLPITAQAQSASVNLSITVTGPPSTAIACPIAFPGGQTAFPEPVAAGTLIASCVVQPTGWSGKLLPLTGADASFFVVSGMNVVVGASPITAQRNYNITVTASP